MLSPCDLFPLVLPIQIIWTLFLSEVLTHKVTSLGVPRGPWALIILPLQLWVLFSYQLNFVTYLCSSLVGYAVWNAAYYYKVEKWVVFHERGCNQCLLACLAVVSLTCYFLMREFDRNTGLIKFNLFVCLFPNNAFIWCLVLFVGVFLTFWSSCFLWTKSF